MINHINLKEEEGSKITQNQSIVYEYRFGIFIYTPQL